MSATIDVEVGPAPDDALRLDEVEEAQELRDAVIAQLAGTGSAVVNLAPRPGALTVAEAFEVVLQAAAERDTGAIRCFVTSPKVKDRLLGMVRGADGTSRRFGFGPWQVTVRCGDITAVCADAVVNASNTRLQLGSGVSGALARAAGPGLQAEMNRLGGVSPGQVAVTGAHGLRTTSRILHVPTASGRPEDVRGGFEAVLRHCVEHRLGSVAIPSLGTGTGNLSPRAAAALFADALRSAPTPTAPCHVILVLWDEPSFQAYAQELEARPELSPADDAAAR